MIKWPSEKIKEAFDRIAHLYADSALRGESEPTIIDSSLMSDLVVQVATRVCPQAQNLLDIGCGGGLYSLKMLKILPNLNIDLHDFSRPMLDGAYRNVSKLASGTIRKINCDVRDLKLPESHYDIILAGAVLHHLRDDSEWKITLQQLFNSLRARGCLWISDMVSFSNCAIEKFMRNCYGEYLERLRDRQFRDMALKQIDKTDSPRSVLYQLDLMKKIGFKEIEILHLNTCFAVFGGIK